MEVLEEGVLRLPWAVKEGCRGAGRVRPRAQYTRVLRLVGMVCPLKSTARGADCRGRTTNPGFHSGRILELTARSRFACPFHRGFIVR